MFPGKIILCMTVLLCSLHVHAIVMKCNYTLDGAYRQNFPNSQDGNRQPRRNEKQTVRQTQQEKERLEREKELLQKQIEIERLKKELRELKAK